MVEITYIVPNTDQEKEGVGLWTRLKKKIRSSKFDKRAIFVPEILQYSLFYNLELNNEVYNKAVYYILYL